MWRPTKAPHLTGLLTVSMALAFASPAQAQVTKLFNATHSLTGDCSITLVDPVPDPGCPDGPQPPQGKLVEPSAVATDAYGSVYVVNRNESKGTNAFHIDIFGPDGHYLTSVARSNAEGVAVDSAGHLYVKAGNQLVRYDPTAYDPEASEISYGSPAVTVLEEGWGLQKSPMVTNLADDHLFVTVACEGGGTCLLEFDAPTDGVPNELLAEEPLPVSVSGGQIAFDRERNRLYVVDSVNPNQFGVGGLGIRVFDSEAPYELLETMDDSNAPPETAGMFSDYNWRFSLAVDEATGHLFVGFLLGKKQLHELDENFDYVGTINKPALENQSSPIAIDNSETSPNQGFLYIPNGYTPAGRLLAYEPIFEPQPPEVESLSFDGVTETEAVLRARINPKGIPTHWVVEYTSQQSFEAQGFATAKTAGEGNLAASGEAVAVQAPAAGLSPGGTYRFRVRAENECKPGGCAEEVDASFTTFAADAQSGSCANEALRSGPSAALPDCRAYELVTPADTSGLRPRAPEGGSAGPKWLTPPASPDGTSVAFMIFGGLIPGMEATGGPTEIGDMYASTRMQDGWRTAPKSPTGSQALRAYNGGLSADHGYFALEPDGDGSLLVGGERTAYVRFPDGQFRLPGEGSLATDPQANMRYISPSGDHIFFQSSIQLEPEAPATGTSAIYDRVPNGVLRVVSLLPGDLTPAAGEHGQYVGESADGSTVAFRVGEDTGNGPFYLRLDNAATVIGAPVGAEYAGFSEDGRYFFYMLAGDLHRFDSESGATEQITETGDIVPVNVGKEGTRGYFLSPSALSVGSNPEGAEPQGGAQNLYQWEETSTRFVATVTDRDAEGEDTAKEGTGNIGIINGLGLWTKAVAGRGFPALLSSRASADGSTLLFESRADLSDYESGGKAQVYLYDTGGEALRCLSCNPTGAPPVGDSSLTSTLQGGSNLSPGGLNPQVVIPNLRADGRRAFFETAEQLVAHDNDGLTDVYEWEAQGVGNCAEPGGCLFLISSGQSGRPEHLFGVSESGDDVFILSSDLLTAEDHDETPSVYDVRVGGGFPPPSTPAGECLGEACQPAVVVPQDPTPASASFRGAGNLRPPNARSCNPAALRARALSRRAARLAGAARRARGTRRAPALRRRAKDLARRSKRANRNVERCRARLRANRKESR